MIFDAGAILFVLSATTLALSTYNSKINDYAHVFATLGVAMMLLSVLIFVGAYLP
jgi:hypothetical protein